jgi:polyhydroxyalkanoate synthase
MPLTRFAPTASLAGSGPRPLAWHLLQAQLAWAGEGQELARFVEAVQAYRRQPEVHQRPAVPVAWQVDSTRLLDYGPPDGWPLLAVPSMVNRSYVLDLTSELSLLRPLQALGFRPLLLDWGAPSAPERRLPLAAFVTERLEAALDWMGRQDRRLPIVLGYCMGGLLAAALAARRPGALAGLVLLATPWDFHLGPWPPAMVAQVARALDQLAGGLGGLPVDLLQMCFMGRDPMQIARKFVRFGQLDPTSAEARRFIALEGWLNDGVPLGAGVAHSCLIDWYAENRPVRGCWTVAGVAVRPDRLRLPCLVVVPTEDRIVPPGSALALATQLPDATVLRPAGGHLGMIVSRHARQQLQAGLHGWLRQIAALQT